MTTPLDEITGNMMRSQAILTLVNEAKADGNLTLDHVGTKTDRFGVTFGALSQDEFDAAVAMVQPAEFSAAEPVGDDIAAALHTPVVDAEPVQVEVQPEPAMPQDEAMAERRTRQEALHLARLDRVKAETAQRTARDAMSKAITAWQSGGPTPDQIRRNEIAAINHDRGVRAEQGHAARNPRVLRSRIDAEAYYGTGGDAATAVRSRHSFGSFHRAAIGDDGLLHRPGKRGSTVPSEG